MGKKLRIAYYQVDTNHQGNFEVFLQRISQIPADRCLGANGMRMGEIFYRQDVDMWEGFIERVRMTNLPEKVNQVNGNRSDLELDANEGLAEVAAFIYKPAYKALLIQKSQYAPSVDAIGSYIQDKCCSHPIEFLCILKRDVLTKLNNMDTVTKFELKTARVNPESIANAGTTANRFLNSLNETGYQRANVIFSSRRQRGGLNNWLKTLAHSLWSNCVTDAVKTIKITGYDTNGEKDILDLLKYKLEDEQTIDDEQRTISFEIRRNALYQSYRNNSNELQTLFGNNE